MGKPSQSVVDVAGLWSRN